MSTHTITRRKPHTFRLTEQTGERINALAERMGVTPPAVIETAVQRMDGDLTEFRSEVIKAARGCIAEADEKLQMMERGHV